MAIARVHRLTGDRYEPFVADETVRRRLTLYRLHFYLIMLIEIPSRGMTCPYADARRARLDPLFRSEFASLEHASMPI